MTRILTALLGLGLAAVGVAGPVQAQEPAATDGQIRFGISPVRASADDPKSFGYFTHYMEPGETLVDEALVVNDGDVPVRLDVYVAEAKTAINGGTAFGDRDEDGSGVAGWVSLSVGEVSLQPGETRIVSFTISVPEDARPGSHVAGLLVELSPTESKTDTRDTVEQPQFSVRVVQRVAVAVVIDVLGARITELTITDLRLSQQHDQGAVFEVDVSNTGNVMINGHGTLTVTDPQGNELAQIPFDMDTILARDKTVFNIDHAVRLTDGDYLLNARIDYRALSDNDTSKTTSLNNVKLEVVNGQPKASDNVEPQQPSTEVSVIGSASDQEDGAETNIIMYATLVAIALTGAAAVAWRRTR